MKHMDNSTREALRILDEFERLPRESGPVVLSEAYLRAVERWEALPENQPGSDKTWVLRMDLSARALWAAARSSPDGG